MNEVKFDAVQELRKLRESRDALLEACKEARDILDRLWHKSAENAFVNRQTAVPWPVVQHLEAAIAKAERKG